MFKSLIRRHTFKIDLMAHILESISGYNFRHHKLAAREIRVIICTSPSSEFNTKTRGSQEPVITRLVLNLTSTVDRKWGCYT